MQIISSKENEQIKFIRKLKEKKYRDETNQYMVEGIKLVKEAMEEKAQINLIVICEDCEEVRFRKSEKKRKSFRQKQRQVMEQIN